MTVPTTLAGSGSLRTLTLLLVSALAVAGARPAQAQGVRAVGGFAGVVQAKQLVSGQPASEARAGLIAGAFLDVATNAPWFDILVEAFVVQRGGKLDVGSVVTEAEVDDLSFALLPKFRFPVGPASVFAYVGPHLDTPLRSRAGGELADIYRQAAPQSFGMSLGAGLELDIGSSGSLRVEFRHDEGVSDVFPDAPDQIRSRTSGILIRWGRR